VPKSEREQFAEWTRDALAHLYDFAYLRQSPLLDALIADAGEPILERVLHLRQLLQQAIESLAPDGKLPREAKEWRPYMALRYYYVDGLELPEVEKRLGLGDRQVLRERNRGLEALAALLWDRRVAPPSTTGAQAPDPSRDEPAKESPVSLEVRQLGVEYVEISLGDLLDNVCRSLSGLAANSNVHVVCQPIDPQLTILADATLLRQAIIAALSYAISVGPMGPVQIETAVAETSLDIRISWPIVAGAQPAAPLPAIGALIEAQGGQCHTCATNTGVMLLLQIPQPRYAKILLVDDNASSLQLYRRYLGQQDYHVICMQGGKEGLEAALTEKPDVVLLDVMMRGMDGWEVLQRLKAQPLTQKIPIIVCSVLPESTLALSLGAEAFLQKPISRFDLLAAIQKCLGRQRSAATLHPKAL